MKKIMVLLFVSLFLSLGFVFMILDILSAKPIPGSFTTTLVGIPYSNDTIFLRYFHLSDYFSGHYYYPGAPSLNSESFVYGKK